LGDEFASTHSGMKMIIYQRKEEEKLNGPRRWMGRKERKIRENLNRQHFTHFFMTIISFFSKLY